MQSQRALAPRAPPSGAELARIPTHRAGYGHGAAALWARAIATAQELLVRRFPDLAARGGGGELEGSPQLRVGAVAERCGGQLGGLGRRERRHIVG